MAVQKLGTIPKANTCNNSSGVSESGQRLLGPGARSLKAEGLLTGALWNAECRNC